MPRPPAISTSVSRFVKSPGAPSPSPTKSKMLAAQAKRLSSTTSPQRKSSRLASSPIAAPASTSDNDDEEEEEFYSFQTDDDDDEGSQDSSDEDDEEDILPGHLEGIDLKKLPTVAKDDATVRQKLEKAKKNKNEDLGVMYIGRLPHGFFEDQLKGYFSQFGTITRLRLSRNKKTGASKHYAFIEFDSSSVAKIVVETMDNYLLMGRLLQCKFIPQSEVHPQLWIGANKKWKRIPSARIERLRFNAERDEDEKKKLERKIVKREQLRKRKIKEAGIDYDFSNVSYAKKLKKSS